MGYRVLLGILAVILPAAAARPVEPILMAAWVGYGESTPFQELATRVGAWWILACACLILAALSEHALSSARGQNALSFLRKCLAFQALLAWFIGLEFFSIAIVAESAIGPQPAPNELQILFVASVASVLMPTILGEAGRRAPSVRVFAFTLLFLAGCAAALDPWMIQGWVVELGFAPRPKSMMLTRNFLRSLPFLAGFVPILLAALLEVRPPDRAQLGGTRGEL